MRTIGVKELKQNASQVLRDVEANGAYVITVAGRPVATIAPLATSSSWVPTADVQRLMGATGTVAPGADWVSDLADFRDASPGLRDPWENREAGSS